MKIKKISVKTKNKKYSLLVGKNIISNIFNILKKEKIFFKKCLIIIDNKVPKNFVYILKKKILCEKIFLYFFNSNEKNKNIKSVDKITNILFEKNFNRDDCIVSLGGGITGDVVGFSASIYKRGLKFINIPTTLLAQVDSSIGGKTGVNNKFGKNLIGSFYQPDLVISDTIFLKTLPKREIICGYGEILKHSLIGGKKNFLFLEKYRNEIINLNHKILQKAILESCKIKVKIIQLDEKERNLRKILNFGHTFAHAYEATLKFSKKLNHGEAVLIGIKSAIKFSFKNKFLSKNKYLKILHHINKLNFKSDLKIYFKNKNIKTILKFMKTDKKNKSDKINLILLKDISRPIINLNFSLNSVGKFLKSELI